MEWIGQYLFLKWSRPGDIYKTGNNNMTLKKEAGNILSPFIQFNLYLGALMERSYEHW